MENIPISELKRRANQEPISTGFHAQIEALVRKDANNGKPFFEITLADAEGKLTLRVWENLPAFSFCENAKRGDFVEITGEFSSSGKFGIEAQRLSARELRDEERDALLRGNEELQEKQAADFEEIARMLATIEDPRLAALSQIFISEYGERFRRAAAARGNHHARRGGLVEHVAQMMRAAEAVCATYPLLNRDLLITGVLFHDSGKLWENQFPVDGFTMPFSEMGELMGHITIGIELVNTLWRKITSAPDSSHWHGADPANEDVRLHLLHLIASHHGQLEFGSPIFPKTPEAWALHYVDHLDAKMEMMTLAYSQSKFLAARIQERVWPLPGNVIQPLPHWKNHNRSD